MADGVIVEPAEKATARFNGRALAILALGHMVIDINQGSLPALLPILKPLFGLSYTLAGVVILVSNLTSSVIQPLFGWWSDWSAQRWLLPWALVLASLGVALIGLAPSYWVLLVLVVLTGFGVASYHPEGYKAANLVAGSRKATGLSLFAIGGNVGIALGPPIVTAAVSGFGLPGTLLMLAPGVAMALIIALILPQLSAEVPTRRTEGEGAVGGGMWGAVRLLIVVVILRSWAQLGLVTFVPFFYVDYLKADPRLVGSLLFVFLGAGAVGTLVGGALADRWGPPRYMMGSLLIVPPLVAAFLLLRGWPAFLFLGAAGFALISTFSVTVVLAQAYLPYRLGMAAGLIVGFAIGAGGIGVTLLGWVADYWGLPVALGLITLMPWAAFVLATRLPEPRRA